jgi:saccharopine dehydrogenase-like NADP-dependent oxidoreductase
MRIVVLGAGRVGSAMVRDLARDFEVTVADVSAEALATLDNLDGVTTQRADLGSDAAVRELVAGHELAVGAVPGPMGHATVRRVIEAGIDLVDISFFEQDAAGLDDLARRHGVMAIVDCGIAPGCSNLVLGHALATWERVDRFACCVGGLPTVRRWPYEYRAVFSPIDVIAEYTRPARLVEGGVQVVRDALSEVEHLDFDGVGTLEAFNTDGLRSLLACPVPDMKEKTLRYPGHAERMRMLRDTGFFGERAIEVDGVSVRPIDVTSKLLFPAWQLQPGEEDLTVMRIEVEGVRAGEAIVERWDLLDRFDRSTGTTSMARTTGYTCTAAVRLVAAGRFREVGVHPPEDVGAEDGCLDFMLARLAERGVEFRRRVDRVGPVTGEGR